MVRFDRQCHRQIGLCAGRDADTRLIETTQRRYVGAGRLQLGRGSCGRNQTLGQGVFPLTRDRRQGAQGERIVNPTASAPQNADSRFSWQLFYHRTHLAFQQKQVGPVRCAYCMLRFIISRGVS
jgi:hypothetical protein